MPEFSGLERVSSSGSRAQKAGAASPRRAIGLPAAPAQTRRAELLLLLRPTDAGARAAGGVTNAARRDEPQGWWYGVPAGRCTPNCLQQPMRRQSREEDLHFRGNRSTG